MRDTRSCTGTVAWGGTPRSDVCGLGREKRNAAGPLRAQRPNPTTTKPNLARAFGLACVVVRYRVPHMQTVVVSPPLEHGYTTAEAAKALSRAPITLRKWRVAGTGPAYRIINGRAFYDHAALVAFIEGHAQYRSTAERTVAERAA